MDNAPTPLTDPPLLIYEKPPSNTYTLTVWDSIMVDIFKRRFVCTREKRLIWQMRQDSLSCLSSRKAPLDKAQTPLTDPQRGSRR